MNQKSFGGTILVVAIVILVGVVGCFVFVKKPELIPQQLVPMQNIKSSTQSSRQPTTSAHASYKEVVSKSFDYGNSEQQFGIIRVAGGSGPSSFSTDTRNYLYITDFQNNRVKIFNSNGEKLLIMNTTKPLIDIAVDDNGNVYGYAGETLYKYNSEGSLLGKIEKPSAFSEILLGKNTYSHLYIFNNSLFIADSQQNSYLISSTEGSFKSESATKINGIYGLSGKRYKTNYADGGRVDIVNQAGITEKTITAGINGLVSLVFLGEDQNDNFYIQAEISSGTDLKLQVLKYNQFGILLTTINVPNNDYSVWTVKLLHIDRTGDIWKVAPGKNKLFLSRWSTIY